MRDICALTILAESQPKLEKFLPLSIRVIVIFCVGEGVPV